MNDRAPLVPLPRLAPDAHKGEAGRVTCVVGSRTMPGAAILAARAAQRAGAGLVSVGCLDAALLTVLPEAHPESVLLDLTDASSEEALAASLAGDQAHARLAGCGLGNSPRTAAVVRALERLGDGAPLVLDADALNVLADDVQRLAALEAPVVLTPHAGEAARLLGREVPREPEGRLEFALELARASGTIVCLKGKGTVIAQGERVEVNTTGNPGMATAGSGDVLAGVLVAYLAAGKVARDEEFTPFEAARLAVAVHGRAGDLAAEELGARAVIASDLVRHLPGAQRELGDARG